MKRSLSLMICGFAVVLTSSEKIIADESPTSKGQSLDEAVAEFNARAMQDAIGSKQPRLTANEVVATIRTLNQSDHDSWTNDVFSVFESIGTSNRLPRGARFEFTNGWVTRGYKLDVWWVDLIVPTNGLPNGFRIRSRLLSSRLLNDEEKQSYERLHAEIIEATQSTPASSDKP